MPLPQERHYTSQYYWNLPEGECAELIDGQHKRRVYLCQH